MECLVAATGLSSRKTHGAVGHPGPPAQIYLAPTGKPRGAADRYCVERRTGRIGYKMRERASVSHNRKGGRLLTPQLGRNVYAGARSIKSAIAWRPGGQITRISGAPRVGFAMGASSTSTIDSPRDSAKWAGRTIQNLRSDSDAGRRSCWEVKWVGRITFVKFNSDAAGVNTD